MGRLWFVISWRFIVFAGGERADGVIGILWWSWGVQWFEQVRFDVR